MAIGDQSTVQAAAGQGSIAMGYKSNVVSGAGAVALGLQQTATGDGAVAIGDPNTATGTGAVAIGANNTATGNAAVALGNNSSAVGASALAIGETATATGAGALAIGPGATASAANSIALGAGASTGGYAGSTAIGAGAKNTAANQLALGASTATLYAPAITSAASLAAQSGATSFVTTDSAGHLAASSGYGPQDIQALYASTASLNSSVATLNNNMIKAYEGTSVAIALGGGVLPDNKKFAVSANWGGYHGTNAFGATALVRVSDNIVLNGGVGVGFTKGDVGGRVGVTFAW